MATKNDSSLASQLSNTLDEETARSEIYGLIAGVLYTSPAIELIAQIRVAAQKHQLLVHF